LPKATGCWVKDIDPAALELVREGAKADLVAASVGEAVKLCIEATGVEDQRHAASKGACLKRAMSSQYTIGRDAFKLTSPETT